MSSITPTAVKRSLNEKVTMIIKGYNTKSKSWKLKYSKTDIQHCKTRFNTVNSKFKITNKKKIEIGYHEDLKIKT